MQRVAIIGSNAAAITAVRSCLSLGSDQHVTWYRDADNASVWDELWVIDHERLACKMLDGDAGETDNDWLQKELFAGEVINSVIGVKIGRGWDNEPDLLGRHLVDKGMLDHETFVRLRHMKFALQEAPLKVGTLSEARAALTAHEHFKTRVKEVTSPIVEIERNHVEELYPLRVATAFNRKCFTQVIDCRAYIAARLDIVNTIEITPTHESDKLVTATTLLFMPRTNESMFITGSRDKLSTVATSDGADPRNTIATLAFGETARKLFARETNSSRLIRARSQISTSVLNCDCVGAVTRPDVTTEKVNTGVIVRIDGYSPTHAGELHKLLVTTLEACK